jgi:hypothetical protein
MDRLILLLIIEALIIFVPSFFCFKSRREFIKCLYSFLFVECFSRWQGVYKAHVQRSLKFAVYFIIVLLASALNIVLGNSLTEIRLFDDPVMYAFKLAEEYDIFFFIFRLA